MTRWLTFLALCLTLVQATAFAKPDYTRRTSKECNFCHPPDSRALNEAGKYYQEHKSSLAGYKPSEQPKSSDPKSSKDKKQQPATKSAESASKQR